MLIVGLTKKSARMSLVLLALLAASAGSSGFAQTACPQGVPPGDPRCGPSPSWHQGQTTPEESAAPRVIVRERFQVWEDRFGAIARDPEGPAGMSEGQRSEEDARIAAVADCVSKGGDPKGCRNIVLEYASGCAVLAWGGGFEQFASGPDDKDNADRAVRRCQERSGTACRVVYSGCSRPVDVGFCPKGVRPPHPSCGPPKR